MLRKPIAYSFIAGASLIALAIAFPAAAQGTGSSDVSPDTGNATVQEIIVTAQFRAQKLQDTPIAITALTSDALDARSANSLADATNGAPSVVLRPASTAFGDSVSASIRGLGQTDFNPAMEPGVGIYVDDVYMPRLTGANLDLLDVQRVEVLRGPQGTLTGKNSEGGAIKFFSKLPSGEDGGYVQGTYGSRHRINFRGGADFTIADGLFGRISGTYASQDGYVNVYDYGCKNPSSGEPTTVGGSKCLQHKNGDVGYQAIRGILRYSPNDELDVVIIGDYMYSSHHSAAQVLLYGNNPNPNVTTPGGLPFDNRFVCGKWCNYEVMGQSAASFVAGFIPPLDGYPIAATSGSESATLSNWGVSGNVQYNLSDDVKFTSITSYREFQNKFSADGDLSPANVGFGNNDVTDWSFSQELRLNAKLGDIASFTLGGYYSDEKAVYYTLQDIRYVAIGVPAVVCSAVFGGNAVETCPIYPLQFIGDDPIRTKSKAVYGNVELTPLENLTIDAGLRYTHDSKSYTFHRFELDGVTPSLFLGTLDGVTATYSGNRLDYRLAANYRFSPQIMAYASIATGYKAGGVGPRPFNTEQAIGFGPEKVTNYELGVKTDLFDRRLRLNLGAFYLDFKDAQLTLLSCPQYGGPGPCALPQNAGNAHSKGVEAEISAYPLPGLAFDGSVSYQDWKWTCINPQVVGLAQGACSSDASVLSLIESRPPAMMKWKWNAGVQYEADLGKSGTLTPRFDISYQGGMIGNVLAPVAGSPSAIYGQLDAYTLANARLAWRNEARDLTIALEVTNLFDKYYFTSKFDLTGAGAGAIAGSPGRPREWAVTVKKSF
jgi:iron complex outermembrane recepter protein